MQVGMMGKPLPIELVFMQTGIAQTEQPKDLRRAFLEEGAGSSKP